MKESDRKQSSLASMEGERNKWAARMTIMVSRSSVLAKQVYTEGFYTIILSFELPTCTLLSSCLS